METQIVTTQVPTGALAGDLRAHRRCPTPAVHLRKILVLASLAVAFAAQAMAAAPASAVDYAWVPQNIGPSFRFTTFQGVFFLNTSQGWAVAQVGEIATTSDGGQTWSPQTSGVSDDLNAVFFVDASRGWAVGGGGRIITTSDGGTTWTPQTSGTSQNFFGVHFVDANHGFATGGDGVYATTNGGTTWTHQFTSATCLSGLAVVDASHAWAAACDGTIIATANGGTTWTTHATGQSNLLYATWFVDVNHGWAVGDSGTIIATSDGGATWTPQTSGTTQSLHSVSFATPTQGAVVGDNGVALHTNDGGATWNMEASNSNGTTLNGVFFPDASQPNLAYAAGGNGTIIKRTVKPPMPVVTSVEPNAGTDLGGNTVTIHGTSLSNAVSVQFGDVAFFSDPEANVQPGGYRVDSDTQITVTTYETPGGTVDVTVGTPGGTSAVTPADRFTFVSAAVGQWAATGTLSTARLGHTATLLLNGKVLVAGGADSTAHGLASAEIYDPTTGAWTPTGSMSQPRAWHTATLLPSGEVLVAGGEVGDQRGLDSAELYDPATGQWSPAGTMTTPRVSQSATLLSGPNCRSSCGKVLVAGGSNIAAIRSRKYLDTTELYDPVTNTWSATGLLNQGRAFHDATLLTGPACVGDSPPSYCGMVLVVGGNSGGFFFTNPPGGSKAYGQPELYDPTTGQWLTGAQELVPREWNTATLLSDGTVLSTAGYNLVAGDQSNGCITDLYHPASASWISPGPLALCRPTTGTRNRGHTATLLPSGQVLVAGGHRPPARGGPPTFGVEMFDPAPPAGMPNWRLAASMTVPRTAHTATLLSGLHCASNCGKVLVVGGASGRDPIASAELYTPPPAPAPGSGPGPAPGSGPGPAPGSSPGPGPGPVRIPIPGLTAGTRPPSVTGYGITNNPFVVGRGSTPTLGSAAAKRHKTGTAFKYTLSEAATVKIAISQRGSGRRRGKRCVVPTRKLRRAKRCARILVRGTLTRTSRRGANRIVFSGRIGSRPLRHGRYQATITATDAARKSSSPQTIAFTIVKR